LTYHCAALQRPRSVSCCMHAISSLRLKSQSTGFFSSIISRSRSGSHPRMGRSMRQEELVAGPQRATEGTLCQDVLPVNSHITAISSFQIVFHITSMAEPSLPVRQRASAAETITPRTKPLSLAAQNEIQQYVHALPYEMAISCLLDCNNAINRSVPRNEMLKSHCIVSNRSGPLSALHLSLTHENVNEFYRRRTYTLQGILHPERKGRLFEHFIVTGLPPDKAVSIPLSSSTLSLSHSKRYSGSYAPTIPANSDISVRYTPEILFCYPPSDSYVTCNVLIEFPLAISNATFPSSV